MKIILNNRETNINSDSISVNELFDIQKFSFKMLIIKINGQLIKKEVYSSSLIKDGDIVDVIHLISGG